MADSKHLAGLSTSCSSWPARGFDEESKRCRRGNRANPPSTQPTDSPNRATGKRYRLFEGTWIEVVLTNRLNATFTGPVNCMVTTNVYSHDRQHVLIPQGSRVLGEARRVDQLGQQRVAVSFHRILMPDVYSVSLDHFQGLNYRAQGFIICESTHALQRTDPSTWFASCS